MSTVASRRGFLGKLLTAFLAICSSGIVISKTKENMPEETTSHPARYFSRGDYLAG